MSKKQAGKGSRPRPYNKKKYDDGYEGIAWRKLNDRIKLLAELKSDGNMKKSSIEKLRRLFGE